MYSFSWSSSTLDVIVVSDAFDERLDDRRSGLLKRERQVGGAERIRSWYAPALWLRLPLLREEGAGEGDRVTVMLELLGFSFTLLERVSGSRWEGEA